MLITILIRTSFRPTLFKRCLDSILSQTHPNIRIIVSYDDERALDYIPEEIEKVRVYKDQSIPFWYDNYCNELKDLVSDGYFVFIDDDEYLISGDCIKNICKHLKKSYGLICQFSRNGVLKPSNELIKQKRIMRTKIGMPCLFLHHSLKNAVDFDGSVGAADYHWIKNVSMKVPLTFVPIVVAYADRRSHGVLQSED